MTNLGQVCLFSNLITIHVAAQWCGFSRASFGLVWWEPSSLYMVRRLEFIVRLSIFQKGVGKSKRGESNINGGSSFLFLINQSKLLSHFVSVSPDSTLIERSL